MNKMVSRVILFDAKPFDREFFEKGNKDFQFEIKFHKSHLTEDTVELAKGFDVVCVFINDRITAPVIEKLVSFGVRLVALRCAGYNNVDLKAAYGHLHFVRVPAYSPYAVAEHAFALILGLNRKTHRAYYRVRDYNFTINGLMGFDMHGKTLGIIGTGQIGKLMGRIARGFSMNILLSDPFPDEAFAREVNARYLPIEELYRQSDILSLHCPLTPQNVHMINIKTLSMMKDGIMIINTGRGKLINTKDLINGLKSEKIGAAGLDVYEEETDYFFEDFSNTVISDDILARLVSFPNVLITSHQAFFTQEALTNITNTTLSNIKMFLENGDLANEICYKCEDICKKKERGKCF
jgi:D-lactate dehydrogenase